MLLHDAPNQAFTPLETSCLTGRAPWRIDGATSGQGLGIPVVLLMIEILHDFTYQNIPTTPGIMAVIYIYIYMESCWIYIIYSKDPEDDKHKDPTFPLKGSSRGGFQKSCLVESLCLCGLLGFEVYSCSKNMGPQ